MPTETQSLSKREFNYGRTVIEYELKYEARQNLAITVRPDKSVLVRVPLEASLQDIHSKLLKRGEWVLKQINFFDKYHPVQPPRQYVSGETHYYLGRPYRLRIRKGLDETINLAGKFFLAITRKPKDCDHLRLLMFDWYATQAQAVFDQRIQKLAPDILGPGFKGVEIEYSPMKTRWGSYISDRRLRINLELIKAPIACIDYVLVHELCHVNYPNHDKKFYAKLTQVLPDWKERKSQLEQFSSV